jgi:hypothetical protein
MTMSPFFHEVTSSSIGFFQGRTARAVGRNPGRASLV